MLNIVHLGKYYAPDTGGIESVTASLAKGAVKAGHQVSVICFKKLPANIDEVIDGVHIYRAPIWKLIASQPLSLPYFVLCIQKARNADIVHLHAPNMLAALFSLILRKKSYLIVHWHSDVVGKGFLGQLLKPLENALLKRANGIIATSKIYADSSLTLKPYYSKVSIIPIGVAEPKFDINNSSNQDDLPEDLAIKLTGKKLILSIGRLVPYKGFSVLIESAKYLQNDAIVFIVGGGELQNKLQASIEAASLSNRVYLVGRLSDKALSALFKRASLYCLPSIERSEAFGVVLLEAMAYGLPIVATNIAGSGVPWVNKHDVSGFNVEVGNPVELANACDHILSSSEEHARLSAGARQRFLNEFTEEVSLAKTLAIYQKLTAPNSLETNN